MEIRNVPVGKIKIGCTHGRDLGDVKALAESIRKEGLLQPIGVTRDFQLVFGKRRFFACKGILHWAEIPCRILDVSSILTGQYVENEMRKAFTPSERDSIRRALELEVGTRQGQRTDLMAAASPGRGLAASSTHVAEGKREGASHIANQNGGTARTTTTAALGVLFSRNKTPVHLVDMDPQASLTRAFGRSDPVDRLDHSLSGRASLPVDRLAPDVTLSPSSIELSRAKTELLTEPGREDSLRTCLERTPLPDNAVVLLGCPPSLGIIRDDPLPPQLLLEHVDFRPLEYDDRLLLLVDPARDNHQQKLPGVEDETHGASVRRGSGSKTSASGSGQLPSTSRNDGPPPVHKFNDAGQLRFGGVF